MSSACSASMKAQVPPVFCISAITWSESVVLPEDSGPKISIMRPFGSPPTPSARSSDSDPVGQTSMFCGSRLSDMRMMAPLPNCFSMLASAMDNAFLRSSPSLRSTGWERAPFFVAMMFVLTESVRFTRSSEKFSIIFRTRIKRSFFGDYAQK